MILLMHCGAKSVEVLSGGGGESASGECDGCRDAATLDPPSNEARVVARDAAELAGHWVLLCYRYAVEAVYEEEDEEEKGKDAGYGE